MVFTTFKASRFISLLAGPGKNASAWRIGLIQALRLPVNATMKNSCRGQKSIFNQRQLKGADWRLTSTALCIASLSHVSRLSPRSFVSPIAGNGAAQRARLSFLHTNKVVIEGNGVRRAPIKPT